MHVGSARRSAGSLGTGPVVPSAAHRSSRVRLPRPLDRPTALRVLQLDALADEPAIKRAYRRLARAAHPDLGGDPDAFLELQRAYEALLGDDARPTVPVGRPSRDREAWSSAHEWRPRTAADTGSVRWDHPLPHPPARLSRDAVAVWLADGDHVPVRPLTATSRAPGSRLNGAAPRLSSDLTAELRIGRGTDDRGRTVVGVVVAAHTRRGRKALDAVTLDGGWVRRRGTSSTRLRWTAPPGDDRRATAVRTADALAELLERAGWPLPTWTATERPAA